VYDSRSTVDARGGEGERRDPATPEPGPTPLRSSNHTAVRPAVPARLRQFSGADL